jgi:hypothetical protein
VEAVVLEDEVLQILVVGDGDERVEVLAGQLVLDADVAEVPAGEGGEVGEPERPLEGQDLGLAVDVGELVVVGTRLDAAPVAHHEAYLGRERRRRRRHRRRSGGLRAVVVCDVGAESSPDTN